MDWYYALAGAVALGLFIYLLVALVAPQRLS